MIALRQGMRLLLAAGSVSFFGCGPTTDTTANSTEDSKAAPCTADNPFLCAPTATQKWATTLEPRSQDGSGNNLDNPLWGSAVRALNRKSTVSYGDGVSTPARPHNPSAREISNAIASQVGSLENEAGGSDLVWQWGQFMDHDLDLSTDANATGAAEPFNVKVPKGDAMFDPTSTGTATITLNRSGYIAGSSPRQQLNKLTAYIDGSQIYGSDPTRTDWLRANDGTGRLKTSTGNLLPFNTDKLPNATNPNDPNQANLFIAGDVRCNEQLGLTSMHTLWMREHNRVAGLLHTQYPTMNDDQVFETARSVVIGEVQHITYDRWLPLLIGAAAVPKYAGYDASVDATVENLFTNLYRVGHTLLSPQLLMMGNDGSPILGGQVSLRDAFFRPDFYIQGAGIEPVLMGQSRQKAQEIDMFVVDDVRNFLFGAPGQGGLDLVSLNIQRGRDHGLPSYNQARKDYGLTPAASWSDISSDPNVQKRLAAAYSSVDEIDPWIGAISEDHVKGAMVGELLQTVVGDQFLRSRNGDRFFYESYLPAYLVQWVKKQTLAMVIKRNTTIGDTMQDDVFIAAN